LSSYVSISELSMKNTAAADGFKVII